MPDMLVKLYNVKPCPELIDQLAQNGVSIKRAMSADLSKIRAFIESEFGVGWADETTKAILNIPSSCYIAVKEGRVVGFAAYDATGKGFFGPTGVDSTLRGLGVGKALYVKCLISMYESGYAYGIIGDAGPTAFYEKTSGAMVIPDCWPGEYKNLVGVDSIKRT